MGFTRDTGERDGQSKVSMAASNGASHETLAV